VDVLVETAAFLSNESNTLGPEAVFAALVVLEAPILALPPLNRVGNLLLPPIFALSLVTCVSLPADGSFFSFFLFFFCLQWPRILLFIRDGW